MDSILSSVKKVLGIEPEYTQFDPDIIMHINTTFSVLNQLGVGPEDGFSIVDDTAVWNNPKLEMVKTYIYLSVRALFDPPASSFVLDSINRKISELEWRLNVAVDPPETKGG